MIEPLKSVAAINAAVYESRAAPAGTRGRGRHAFRRHPAHTSRAGTQELELTQLRAVNDELPRQHEQTAALRDHYKRLAIEMLTTLKHIDVTIHELPQKAFGTNSGSCSESPDAALISLAGDCRRRVPPTITGSSGREVAPQSQS